MNIFINPEDQRPRAGWRIAIHLILFLLLVMVLMLFKNSLFPSLSFKLLEAILMGTAGIASLWFATSTMDRRPLANYGLEWNRHRWNELWLGLGLGALAISLIFIIQWGFGWISITGFGWERHASLPYPIWLLSYLGAMLIIGFYEELIFRGYQIFNMVEGFHNTAFSIRTAATFAIAISSIIFGILHAANPNADMISTLNIILAGVMLALPYLLTGSLAISIGIHISWNFVQGGIFGFAVSGTPFRGSLIQLDQKGETFITGGNFGPEAGLLGVFGVALIVILTLWYIKARYGSLTIHPLFLQDKANSVKRDE